MIKNIFAFALITLSFSSHATTCESVDIPISFDEVGLPYIPVSIGESSYLAQLDLGSQQAVHLSSEALTSANAVKYTGDIVKSMNIKGEVTKAKQFMLPDLKLGCMHFIQLYGIELSPWSVSIGTEKNDSRHAEKIDVVIGRALFHNLIISLDYKNSKLILRSKKSADLWTNAQKFEESKEGIVLKAVTDAASYEMVLDSGASSSLLVSNKVSKKEKVEKCDFYVGENIKCRFLHTFLTVGGYKRDMHLLLYPIEERFTKSGILGADFLRNVKVTINFLDNKFILEDA